MASTNDLIAQNQQLRALALALFPRARKNLGNFSATGVNTAAGGGGGSARIKLYNVGLGTGLLVEVVANVTIGVAATTLSGPQSPWNIVSKFRLTDYDGTDRINCSGYGAFLAGRKRTSSVGRAGPYPQASAVFGSATAPSFTTAMIGLPNLIDPDITLSTGTRDIRLFYYLPLAYDPESDLRGAVLMQTALGEMYLNIDFNNTFQAAANVDSPFAVNASSTVAVNSISVNVWQDYLLLQAVGGQTPLPQLDLLTVYELNELRSTDNIAIAQEKLINFPNVRSVMGMMLYYVNNAAMTANLGDINRFRLIVNGNNVLIDNSDRSQLITQRILLEGNDFGASTYFWDFARKPIETAVYGNVQMGVTPAAFTAGNTHMDILFESMYTKGSVLPGLSQSA